jgi:hypothetical protein
MQNTLQMLGWFVAAAGHVDQMQQKALNTTAIPPDSETTGEEQRMLKHLERGAGCRVATDSAQTNGERVPTRHKTRSFACKV